MRRGGFCSRKKRDAPEMVIGRQKDKGGFYAIQRVFQDAASASRIRAPGTRPSLIRCGPWNSGCHPCRHRPAGRVQKCRVGVACGRVVAPLTKKHPTFRKQPRKQRRQGLPKPTPAPQCRAREPPLFGLKGTMGGSRYQSNTLDRQEGLAHRGSRGWSAGPGRHCARARRSAWMVETLRGQGFSLRSAGDRRVMAALAAARSG